MSHAFKVVLAALFWITAGTALSAQEVPAQSDTGFASAVEKAVEQGGTVIVLDAQGRVVGQSATTPEPDDQQLDEHGRPVGKPMGSDTLMMAQTEVQEFRNTLRKRLDALPASINEVLYVLRASSPTGEVWAFAKTLLWGLALFGVGILFERYVYGYRLASKIVMPRIKEHPEGFSEKLNFLMLRFFMGLIGVLVSMIVAYLVGTILFGEVEDSAIQFTIVIINIAYFGSRVFALLWRMILSPYLEQYRIPAFSAHDSKKLHHWLWILATFDLWTLMFAIWLSELGLNYDIYALMYGGLTLLASFGHITMVLVNRRAVSNALRDGNPPSKVSIVQRIISTIWAPVAIFYIVGSWLELLFNLVLERPTSVPALIGAYAILATILIVYALMNYVIERFFSRARALRERAEAHAAAIGADPELEGDASPELSYQHPIHSFEGLARRAAGICALVAGLFISFRIWGAQDMLPEDLAFYNGARDIIVIAFIGYLVFHAFRIWIDIKIAEEQGPEEEAELGDEGGGSSASRLATLLPLFRNTILIVIFVAVFLVILLELGINVSPLFAGAGVVGLAVGFGAQSLVRDIFSGAFFLLDDAFRKGEYIDTGGVKGTVEKISVRSFQLRHHLGPLHTIPFGEIQQLTNYSRDWVIMKLPLRVTYDTDVERVRKLIKKLGIALLDDPVIGPDFIQPLKSQGVIEMQDSAMIIRVKFMTKPGDQWMVRKRVFQEIRDLFEREGIRFAHREVTVRLADADPNTLTTEQKEKIAAAAHSAVMEEELLEGGPETSGDDR